MKKLYLIVVVLFFSICSQSAFAWEVWNPSFYVGAGYGLSEIDTGVSGLTGTAALDEDNSGFKILGGLKFNQFLGIEVGYTDFGEAELSGNNGDRFSIGGTTYQFIADGVKLSAEATSIQIAAVYFIPLDYYLGESMKYFEPFLKLGISFWDVEYSMTAANVDQARADDDGSDAIFGIGINFKIHEKFHLRTEWERHNTEESIDYYSASVLYNF